MFLRTVKFSLLLVTILVVLDLAESKFRVGGGVFRSRSRFSSSVFSRRSTSVRHDYGRGSSAHLEPTYRRTSSVTQSSRIRDATRRPFTSRQAVTSRYDRRMTVRPTSRYSLTPRNVQRKDPNISKINTDANYYRPAPTLKPLYPRQANTYQGGYYHAPPTIVNQPVYVSPASYYSSSDSSLLGMYVGYRIGSSFLHHPHYYHSNSHYHDDTPQYAIVHHYHHYGQRVPKKIDVEPSTLAQCGNLTEVCMANTTALCMTNGTIFCITPLENTVLCQVDGSYWTCVNTTLTLPCTNGTNCDETKPNVTNLSVPCISKMELLSDFVTNKLTVNKVDAQNGKAFSDTTAEKDELDHIEKVAEEGKPSVTISGVINRYCVVLIAEPMPQPKNMKNVEYVEYLKNNTKLHDYASAKGENLFKLFLLSIFS